MTRLTREICSRWVRAVAEKLLPRLAATATCRVERRGSGRGVSHGACDGGAHGGVPRGVPMRLFIPCRPPRLRTEAEELRVQRMILGLFAPYELPTLEQPTAEIDADDDFLRYMREAFGSEEGQE